MGPSQRRRHSGGMNLVIGEPPLALSLHSREALYFLLHTRHCNGFHTATSSAKRMSSASMFFPCLQSSTSIPENRHRSWRPMGQNQNFFAGAAALAIILAVGQASAAARESFKPTGK